LSHREPPESDAKASPETVRLAQLGPWRGFYGYAQKDQSTYLAEISADGSDYREVMRGSSDAPVSCGYWTPDGNYLVARLSGDIWLIPMKNGVFRKRFKPLQLTNGPLFYSSLCPSRDGKRIFAIGSKWRGELVRYDKKSNQFIPFLSGISAIGPNFSRDGQWVVYVSFPDYNLWRSRADGADRMQLTYPPTRVRYALISPDGKRVVFATDHGKQVLMNLDGTSQQEIPRKDVWVSSWSPDGNSLALQVPIEGKRVGEENFQRLETIDLQSWKSSVVPSSQGINGGFWVASDTLIGATEDGKKLVALNLHSGKQTELASGVIVDFWPSPDQKYLHYSTGGTEPKAMRIRLFGG